mmetsp:Transcript_21469/g.35943  ORF Transcript_21469/g.35943 Transcript_21469/m.35943 type:complete len:297 (-) Transcript_21469:1583-2473(-)
MNFIWELGTSLLDYSTHDGIISQYDHLFVPQSHSWDCGVACCNMVIKWSNDNCTQEPPSESWVKTMRTRSQSKKVSLIETSSLKRQTPLWTVEIFSLLHEYLSPDKIESLSMYTLCTGINPEHFQLDWYARCGSSEMLSIRDAFERVKLEGWSLVEKSLSIVELQDLVRNDDVTVVLLVDGLSLNSKIEYEMIGITGNISDNTTVGVQSDSTSTSGDTICSTSGSSFKTATGGDQQNVSNEQENVQYSELAKGSTTDYSGHYIVLMDYNRDIDKFACLNPSFTTYGELIEMYCHCV